ncbi:Mu DNA-binding domain-containing protein [Roseivivax halotolerans]|uniref:Mu DNA-binding domain-containing protein n=1 Tax=Roseivivax halotolerans TaxID=93684 RepID=A0A1I5W231_9RHOB|nr:transposase domain-containing protein [Roseivivax halotolerans]SFQ13740.1 Mu DNA-binding domain-containing protein [Roseivivax halotolerans]
MSDVAQPKQIWWSVSELAEARLPGLPGTRQRINALAKRQQWTSYADKARRKVGGGGGWEYHWTLLPLEARARLLKDASAGAAIDAIAQSSLDLAERHYAFEQLSERAKQTARKRLRILNAVMAQEAAGLGKDIAVREVARAEGCAARSIWNWFDKVLGVERSDWLPCLADGRGLVRRDSGRKEIDPEFMEVFKADYLRFEGPGISSAYRRAVRVCEAQGIECPPESRLRRHLDAEVPRVSQIYQREGLTGLQKCYPPQIRDRTGMTAMEGVNADCHKFDVFVQWEGRDKPARAQLVAFQDIYSGKILSWRIDHTPNKVMVMAAFGDMIDNFGIPKHALFDNGREFANKWLTGGADTRFRFKIREDDPLGVLALLGIDIHWATPGHGQAKPIERAFRDLAEDIAKDPRFAGAYVGNRPDAKPENYGSRAIPIDDFIAIVAEGIDAHNARQGRLSQTANGRSFDETFAASYANAPIRKAAIEQRRLWLMGQEPRKLHANHGELTLFKNKYWADWMAEHAGQQIVARFNPADLHSGAEIYDLKGRYLGFAACREAVGFFDLTEAHDKARQDGQIRRAQKQLAQAINPGSVKDVATRLDELAPEEPAAAEARVVRPTFGDPAQTDGASVRKPALPTPDTSPEAQSEHSAFVHVFYGKQGRKKPETVEDEARSRFRRALDVEARSEAGERIGEAEAKWLQSYQETPEYRQLRNMYEKFGERLLLG